MEFKEFDQYVSSYVGLDKNRYLVTFNSGDLEFYKLKEGVLIKEK